MVSKILQRGKFFLDPAPNYSRNLGWDNSKKDSNFGGKEGEAFSAIRNSVLRDAENFGLVPILELNSDNESTRDQALAHCNKMYDIAIFNKIEVCVTIKKYGSK